MSDNSRAPEPVREPLTPLPPELLDHIVKNSHATSAISGAAAIDDKLAEKIERKFPNLSNTLRDKLFRGYGPLASFSVRIDVAFAFGIIDADLKSDLEAIRQIRNAFAHSSVAMSLTSPEPLKWLQRLRGYNATLDPLSMLLGKMNEVSRVLDPLLWALVDQKVRAEQQAQQKASPEPSPPHPPLGPDGSDKDGEGPPQSSRE